MALNSLPEADFVACCDQDVERARATATKYSVPQVFDNADDLLREADVEAVLICTPHPAHERLVVASTQAGVHVLCEKPISVTVDAATRMIDAAKAAGT